VDAGTHDIELTYIVSVTPGGALAGGVAPIPFGAIVLGHFDAPTPTGAIDSPSPSAGHFDAPTPTLSTS
jgi:hypothetical protein